MKFQTLKIRAHFAWQILRGTYEPAPIVGFGYAELKAKSKALELALQALYEIGKRPRGGSVSARAAYDYIVTRLTAQGIRVNP